MSRTSREPDYNLLNLDRHAAVASGPRGTHQERTRAGGVVSAHLQRHHRPQAAHRRRRPQGRQVPRSRIVCVDVNVHGSLSPTVRFRSYATGLSKFAKLARSVTRSRSVLVSALPALKEPARQSQLAHVSTTHTPHHVNTHAIII